MAEPLVLLYDPNYARMTGDVEQDRLISQENEQRRSLVENLMNVHLGQLLYVDDGNIADHLRRFWSQKSSKNIGVNLDAVLVPYIDIILNPGSNASNTAKASQLTKFTTQLEIISAAHGLRFHPVDASEVPGGCKYAYAKECGGSADAIALAEGYSEALRYVKTSCISMTARSDLL